MVPRRRAEGAAQTRVEIGDQVLDRGVPTGNTRTKLALQGKSGLGAVHVFGKNVATLTKEKIALEPGKVLEAVGRLDDVPDFADRAALPTTRVSGPYELLGTADEWLAILKGLG
jgi:hypothetical protein